MGICYEERTIGDTTVFIGERLSFPHCLRRVAEEGALLFLYDENVSGLADEIIGDMKSAYRIIRYPVLSERRIAMGEKPEPVEVPEYIRHVFALGGGSAAMRAKAEARALRVGYSVALTAPSCDGVMSDFAPKAVFISRNILIKCPIECVAAGYGHLYSSPLDAFERLFDIKVLAQKREELKVKPTEGMSLTELAYALLESSAEKGGKGSADLVAAIMYERAVAKGRRPRLIGEYKFVASCALKTLYSHILGAPAIDVIPPACADDALGELKDLEEDFIKRGKKVDFFDINGYFRISYILSEYRMDLLDKLSGSDMRPWQRAWRRLYPDAGYWMKGEMTCKDVMRAIATAGAISDGFLGYVYATGALSAMR